MQCTTCKLEYIEYSSITTHKIFDKKNNMLLIAVSVMACPKCGEINESTLQVIDRDEL